MPAAKIFDQNISKNILTTNSGMSVPLVNNPIKTHVKKTEKTEEEKQLDQKRAEELTIYKNKLEDELLKKLDELKTICLEEAEITGILPVEIFLTLHPDEPAPQIKRKVGTTFAFSEDVLANALTDDKLALLETDIRIQKEIVAATERMSKDRLINKSLRKKHRRDLQSAQFKLRNLQKGLNKIRLSMSKPDVSSLEGSLYSGSVNSLHSSKSWFNSGNSAKSCPTTPRGSVPDLCDADDRLSNNSRFWTKSPSNASFTQIHQTTTSTNSGTSITTTTSPNDSGIHSTTTESSPPIPVRRKTMPSTKTSNLSTKIGDDPHVYENIGYHSSQPYQSAYRQSNFPTINNCFQKPMIVDDNQPGLKTSISAQFPRITNSSTNFGTKSHSVSQFSNLSNNQQITLAANNQLGRIVRKMSNGVLSPTNNVGNSSQRMSMANPPNHVSQNQTNNGGFSTTSLDRRLLRQKQTGGEIDGSPSTSNGSAAQTSTKLTTTFPVGTAKDQMASEPTQHESNDLRLRSISQHNGIGFGIPHTVVNPRHHSTSRLPPGDWSKFNSIRDPQMEALLNYYREGVFSKQLTPNQIVNSTPTTRIVPIEQKSSSSTRTNGATMV
uniref:Cytohesin Ubiquitin Protein Inducing domain-containing protein n=1 Tax=Panagrolaimus sp. JU765 TaxID=591449 RepID=A0AC34Q961_9BILA